MLLDSTSDETGANTMLRLFPEGPVDVGRVVRCEWLTEEYMPSIGDTFIATMRMTRTGYMACGLLSRGANEVRDVRHVR